MRLRFGVSCWEHGCVLALDLLDFEAPLRYRNHSSVGEGTLEQRLIFINLTVDEGSNPLHYS